MDRRSFHQFVGGLVDQLSELSREQLLHVAHAVGTKAQAGRAGELIEDARLPQLRCPRCEGIKLYRDGQANGLQRFRCRACRRTFNCLTGTPLARLRLKDKWLGYCATLRDPATTLRRAAETIAVHRTTAFRWRHRMLAWVKLDRQTPLQGIVEVDEQYVLESHKVARQLDRPARKRGGKASKRGISTEQVCVLVARDRAGRTHDAVIGKGPLTRARLDSHLAPALGADVLLRTDRHPAYRHFAALHGITHHTIHAGAGEHARGAIHVQNVNAYQSRLRAWLHHFSQRRHPIPEQLLRLAPGHRRVEQR